MAGILNNFGISKGDVELVIQDTSRGLDLLLPLLFLPASLDLSV